MLSEPVPAGTAGAHHRYTVGGLVTGTTYTFQLRAVNGEGSGPAAQEAAAPADRQAPMLLQPPLTGADVPDAGAGRTVVLTFDETLDPASVPDGTAFAVTVDGRGAGRPPRTHPGALPGDARGRAGHADPGRRRRHPARRGR